ncbi:response regulator transcription factor [Raineyella sp. LH-20]|uniref:response regulator transcription factor n=1 Tax=Raineyella sp. LH-20 TaxID=3081204 RepID=UPI002954EB99|nr:response regulator transcription factor [Raineyella sp. LH-20]WOP18223.1 response regulator transcription factor [Raineyella sp. LH-20]
MDRILVVEDEDDLRALMVDLVRREVPTAEVSGAGSGEAAVAACDQQAWDLVLMDIRMPGIGGVEATRQIVARHPDARVVMMTSVEDSRSVRLSVAAGAQGYVVKGLSGQLEAVVHRALGDVPVSAEALDSLIDHTRQTTYALTPGFKPLSAREREVFWLMADGLSNKQIAQRLFLSPNTVKDHVASILVKCRVSTRAAAIVAARQNGLVDLTERPNDLTERPRGRQTGTW